MISAVSLRGFKRFHDARFEMAPLTVLTGMNGSGKTSMLQGFLLAKEGSVDGVNTISLNGPFGLELGTAEDVLNWQSDSPIQIRMESFAGKGAEWSLEIPSEDALYLNVLSRPDRLPKAMSSVRRAFTYLSAERLGPRGHTAASPLPDAELEVGVRGEYCAHVLAVLGDRLIESIDRSHPLYDGEEPRLLKYELEQWLSEMTRPIEVAGNRLAGSAVAELRFRSLGSDWVKSTNMGFGLTYSLPIVLAGLIAETGGLILVENPEAHLHPAGQSRMGVFLAWLAGRGIQVVVETHSDHVVNGIRRGIAEYGYLDPSSAVLHWFGADDERGEASHMTLAIGGTGSVSEWPKGFFDQYQIDVASLGRIRRGRRGE